MYKQAFFKNNIANKPKKSYSSSSLEVEWMLNSWLGTEMLQSQSVVRKGIRVSIDEADQESVLTCHWRPQIRHTGLPSLFIPLVGTFLFRLYLSQRARLLQLAMQGG
jgi:hypothetical protein